MDKAKVLVTGPVKNDFSSLTSKLISLQKSKAGPFNICFCVGPFFGVKNGDNVKTQTEGNDGNYQQAKDFLSQGAPIPVYFCDVGRIPAGIELPSYETSVDDVKDEAEISLDDEDDGNEKDGSTKDSEEEQPSIPKEIVKIAHNVYHLRGISYESMQTADIINISIANDDKNYLTIAFLPPNTRMGTPRTAQFESKTGHPSYIGCDILLTSEWGQGMAGSSCLANQDKTKLLENFDTTFNLSDIGSFDVAEVASQCRPRYHFAPSSSVIPFEKSDEAYEKSFFLQSLQYTNPPSALSSGVIKKYHTSRFLALCQVVEAKKAKERGKAKKYIHALGIQPLWSMDRATATAVPANAVVESSPYTDDNYGKDDVHSSTGATGAGAGVQRNVGLSEAQTRRILCEEPTGDHYRWNMRNRKRPLADSSPPTDPSNSTLFLHGLHKDVSRGVNLNRASILRVFQAHGCTRVRYPGNDRDTGLNGRLHSFCFLEFPTHFEASQCLMKVGGTVEVAGISLSLKWSSGTNRKQDRYNIPPPPPPGFQGVLMSNEAQQQHSQKRQRVGLKEAEAIDSSSLFIHLRQTWTPEQCSTAITKLEELAQNKLEDAINGDGNNDRVTAEEEPALKVTSKALATMPHCGFLSFASHAAASMALATLTGSTDGGALNEEFRKDQELLQDAQLWWGKQASSQEGKGQNSGHNFQKHHFPLDARTDCWFCLASPTCEKHLIVSLSNHSYIAMAKGPVNNYHALIVTINHGISEDDDDSKKEHIIGAFLEPDPSAVAEIEDTKLRMRNHANKKLDKDLYVFERAIPTKKGYHPHVNCIPIERGLGAKLRSTMLSMAAADSKYGNGFELREIQNPEMNVNTILKSTDDLDGYFYVEIPFGGSDIKRYLYKYNAKDTATKFVPLEFGRELLASVVENQKIASWKNNVMTKEQEEECTTEFRKSFEE